MCVTDGVNLRPLSVTRYSLSNIMHACMSVVNLRGYPRMLPMPQEVWVAASFSVPHR